MSNDDIRTENRDAFNAKGSSDYLYGWPHDNISILDHTTSAQEAMYRAASNQDPLGTILIQVGGNKGEIHTIYEAIPHGSDFLLGSRFKSQELKTPAGIILFSNPKVDSVRLPFSISQIDQSMPAVIKFWDSSSKLQTLNLNDYAMGGERLNWAKILRNVDTSSPFQLSYTDIGNAAWKIDRHTERKNVISKKPLVGWAEFDLTSPMSFETGIKPGYQYGMHQGDAVVSIINVREERDKIKKFIVQNTAQNVGDIDSFAAEARSHADMLERIFHGLTGTRNGSLYNHIYKLAGGFKEKINEMIDANPVLARNLDIEAALASLDLKIPKAHFLEKSGQYFTLDSLELNGNVSSEVTSHLSHVGQLSGTSAANNNGIDRTSSLKPSTGGAQAEAMLNGETVLPTNVNPETQVGKATPLAEMRTAAQPLPDALKYSPTAVVATTHAKPVTGEIVRLPDILPTGVERTMSISEFRNTVAVWPSRNDIHLKFLDWDEAVGEQKLPPDKFRRGLELLKNLGINDATLVDVDGFAGVDVSIPVTAANRQLLSDAGLMWPKVQIMAMDWKPTQIDGDATATLNVRGNTPSQIETIMAETEKLGYRLHVDGDKIIAHGVSRDTSYLGSDEAHQHWAKYEAQHFSFKTRASAAINGFLDRAKNALGLGVDLKTPARLGITDETNVGPRTANSPAVLMPPENATIGDAPQTASPTLDGVDAPSSPTPEMKIGKATPVAELRTASPVKPVTAAYSSTAQVAANDGRAGQPMTDVADSGGRNSAAKFMPKPSSAALPTAANDVVDAIADAGRAIGGVSDEMRAVQAFEALGTAGRFSKLLKAGASKIPVAGLALASGFGAYALYHAEQGHNEGKLTDGHIAAVRTALLPYIGSQAGSLLSGVAGEEAVEAALVKAGVPEEYRIGTLRTAIVSGAHMLEEMNKLNARKAELPAPAVSDFIRGMSSVDVVTKDSALNDYFDARDKALTEAKFGRPMGAKVGNMPVSASETQAIIDNAARTYMAMGGSLETAQFALSENPEYARASAMIQDVINLAPSRNTHAFPTADRNLEALKKLKQQGELNPSAELDTRMVTAAAAYVKEGGTARDALVSYYHLAPFGVSTETVKQLEGDKAMLKLMDGSDGTKANGKLSPMEIGQGLVNIGVYNGKLDVNRDGEATYAEIRAAVRNPGEFQAQRDNPSNSRTR